MPPSSPIDKDHIIVLRQSSFIKDWCIHDMTKKYWCNQDEIFPSTEVRNSKLEKRKEEDISGCSKSRSDQGGLTSKN